MPVPGNYNSPGLTIKVDPAALWRYATVDIKAHAEVIADAISRIADIWSGLQVGWAGESADEAQGFSSRLAGAFTRLYGSAGAPESGAIAMLQKAVGKAGFNYAAAEDQNWRMFAEFSYGMDKGSVSKDKSPPFRSDDSGPGGEHGWPG
jgi:hypothetical protein